VVGRAASLLSPRRAATFVALGVVVVAYYAWCASLPNLPFWWDVGLLAFPIIPVVLALVPLLLPLRRVDGWWLLGAAAVLALAAFLFDRADWQVAANFAKLFAPVFFGWWFLEFFERLSWVLLVAVLVPFVDAYSVWRGPTHHIVTHQQHVFTSLSIAFPVPDTGAARLGLPDVLFFALFLGAADRFGLRVRLSFLLMAVSFGVTVVVANALNVDGLPALPFLSAAFLLANADLLLERRRAAKPG
jgi:hypothetical protein